MSSQLQSILQQAFIYTQQASFGQAKPLFEYILKIQPKNFDALHALGFICGIENNHQEAFDYSLRALKIKPDDLEVNINCAKALQVIGRHSESLKYHQKAIFLSPNNHKVWLGCGKSLQCLKRYDEAITHYDKALSLNPEFAEAWSNKGDILNELRCYDDAIAYYDKALSLKPDYHEAWSNKGVTLNELKRYDEAITHYDKALSLKPDYHVAWSNKGVTLHELKRYDEAIAHYDKALSLKPDYHEASWNKSLSLLLQGDFENGFPLYESRWYSEKISAIAGKRSIEKPTWLGLESLKGKTILLHGEQGLGDFIQFCRYAKLVADLGAKVILEVPQPLAGLMKDLEGVSELVDKGKELPFFDYQSPLLSLPLALKTNLSNIPNAIGYINNNNHQNKTLEWETRLGPKLKSRVGLVWSGNPNQKNDHNRSLLLANVLPFLASQFEYVSLQKEVREVDKLTLELNSHILNFASHLNDFVDTAALIENLDLVISVDTSVAHLSGALGKKTWTLLSNVPDWRWLLDREDSPWYPSMKLYRQTSIDDWNGVLDRVKSDLIAGFYL